VRNLVRLGRFDLPDLTTTDRMRILAGYTAMRERRILIRRVNAMLKQRIRRDGIAFVNISGGK
jgi:hypothetical protein